MSRHTNFQFRGEREGRVAQMNRQEEVIARKRQEILEKQKTNELAKQVAAAQCGSTPPVQIQPNTKIDVPAVSTTKDAKQPLIPAKQTFEAEPIPPKNNFTNDGSFFENFRKITEAAKKAEEEKHQIEADRLAKEQEQQKAIENSEQLEQKHEPILVVPHSMPPP